MKALALVGATASGKTALSLEIAQQFNCEIICCDSMQVYKHMDIGTAKATPDEQSQVRHHLLDFLSPDTPYSAADYAIDAYNAAKDIQERGKLPLFCGGTGLYLEAARTGRHAESPSSDEKYRAHLTKIAQTENGKDILYDMLCACDEKSALAIHKTNVKRVIRALEIFHVSGVPKSEWDERTKQSEPQIDLLCYCILYHDREILYKRIDTRVDEMIKTGLKEETRFLLDAGYLDEKTTASQAIGYKEYAEFLRGEISETEAIEKIKLSTRHYAKRQLTWFSSKEHIKPLYADEGGVIATAKELCDKIREDVFNFVNKS